MVPLEGYRAFHATRAGLPGRSEEPRAAYGQAIRLAGNTAGTAYLIRRRDQLARPVNRAIPVTAQVAYPGKRPAAQGLPG